MKKITYLTFTFLLAFIMMSCSKDKNNSEINDDNGDPIVPTFGVVKARIDGRDFVSDYAFAILDTDDDDVISLSVSGASNTDENIALHFYNFTGIGTYEIGENKKSFGMYAFDGGVYGSFQDTDGFLRITEYAPNEYVSGTFEFKGVNIVDNTHKNITDGTFSVEIITMGD